MTNFRFLTAFLGSCTGYIAFSLFNSIKKIDLSIGSVIILFSSLTIYLGVLTFRKRQNHRNDSDNTIVDYSDIPLLDSLPLDDQNNTTAIELDANGDAIEIAIERATYNINEEILDKGLYPFREMMNDIINDITSIYSQMESLRHLEEEFENLKEHSSIKNIILFILGAFPLIFTAFFATLGFGLLFIVLGSIFIPTEMVGHNLTSTNFKYSFIIIYGCWLIINGIRVFFRTYSARKRTYEIKQLLPNRTALLEQNNQKLKSLFPVRFNLSLEAEKQYENLSQVFDSISQCTKIWQHSQIFDLSDDFNIKFKRTTGMFPESNCTLVVTLGSNTQIIIFPLCLLFIHDGAGVFIDIRDVSVIGTPIDHGALDDTIFDSEVCLSRWQYENKDGSRDMRRKSNQKLHVVRHGQLLISSSDGFKLDLILSKSNSAEEFANAFTTYINNLPIKTKTEIELTDTYLKQNHFEYPVLDFRRYPDYGVNKDVEASGNSDSSSIFIGALKVIGLIAGGFLVGKFAGKAVDKTFNHFKRP